MEIRLCVKMASVNLQWLFLVVNDGTWNDVQSRIGGHTCERRAWFEMSESISSTDL